MSHTHTHTHTHTQRERERERERKRERERERERESESEAGEHAGTQARRRAGGQAFRRVGRQADRQTHTHTCSISSFDGSTHCNLSHTVDSVCHAAAAVRSAKKRTPSAELWSSRRASRARSPP